MSPSEGCTRLLRAGRAVPQPPAVGHGARRAGPRLNSLPSLLYHAPQQQLLHPPLDKYASHEVTYAAPLEPGAPGGAGGFPSEKHWEGPFLADELAGGAQLGLHLECARVPAGWGQGGAGARGMPVASVRGDCMSAPAGGDPGLLRTPAAWPVS